MDSSSSNNFNPRLSSGSTIPSFDENDLTLWKAKAISILEIMDYNMLDIIKNGPHIPTYQPTKNGVAYGPKRTSGKHQFSEDDRQLVMLNVRARTAIGNSLPYRIYQRVQYAASAKEMLENLTATYGVADAAGLIPAVEK